MSTQSATQTIAISGASGLIGRALRAHLAAAGYRTIALVRHDPRAPDEVRWDPETGIADASQLAHVDAMVHLAGENIAGGRWTATRKAALRRSRVDATRALLASLARVARRPGTLLCASAVGYYGSRGDEVLTEEAGAGRGYLADLCQDWEQAAADCQALGMRWATLRFGVILSALGGMLARLLPVFRAGVGGPVGDGRQFVSWIAQTDAVRAIEHVLREVQIHGPVNIVAPEPVTNAVLTRTLATILQRPAMLRVPAWAARLAFGEMADEALLASARAVPALLVRNGFTFLEPQLAGALRRELEPRTTPN
jgi:uncharacterized protein (TIGR01777 family)